MTSEQVLAIYNQAERLDIQLWIDGGWAVDALVGKQTRPHADLDLAIEKNNLDTFKSHLRSQGYQEIPHHEDIKWDSVWRDETGKEIELHAFELDQNNEIVKEPHWDGYSKTSLNGIGSINSQPVRCVSLEQLLKTHDPTKRKLAEKDRNDVVVLRERFGTPT